MKFRDLGTLFDGPHATPLRLDSGPYFLNISSLCNGRLDLEKSDHVSEADFQKWTRRVQPQPGDLLFSYETRLGEAALMPPSLRACLGRRMALIRPDRNVVNPRFLLYWFLSPQVQSLISVRSISGATVPRIPLNELPDWPAEIPPLPEQQAIAEVLGALDDKIAVNTRITKTSREMISALFTTAVTENANVRPLPSALRITFGEPFGGRYFTIPGVGRPVLRIRDIRRGRSDVWTRESRPNETLVQAGQIVAGMDAEFEPAIWLGETSLLNQRVCLVESSQFGNAFAREMAAPAMAQIENEKSGTTVIHMNKSDLERVSVTVPTGPHARSLAEQANCVLRLIVALARESQTLAELRDTLLPALMDGTIRVKDAVQKAEEVL